MRASFDGNSYMYSIVLVLLYYNHMYGRPILVLYTCVYPQTNHRHHHHRDCHQTQCSTGTKPQRHRNLVGFVSAQYTHMRLLLLLYDDDDDDNDNDDDDDCTCVSKRHTEFSDEGSTSRTFAVWLLVLFNRNVAVKFIRIMVLKVVR